MKLENIILCAAWSIMSTLHDDVSAVQQEPTRSLDVAFILDSSCMTHRLFRLQLQLAKTVAALLELANDELRLAAVQVWNTSKDNNNIFGSLLYTSDQSSSAAKFGQQIEKVNNLVADTQPQPVSALLDGSFNQTAKNTSRVLLLFTDGCNHRPLATLAKTAIANRHLVTVVYFPNRISQQHTDISQTLMERFLRLIVASDQDMMFVVKKGSEIKRVAGLIMKTIHGNLQYRTDVVDAAVANGSLLFSEQQHHSQAYRINGTEELLKRLQAVPAKMDKIPMESQRPQTLEMLKLELEKIKKKYGNKLKPEIRFVNDNEDVVDELAKKIDPKQNEPPVVERWTAIAYGGVMFNSLLKNISVSDAFFILLSTSVGIMGLLAISQITIRRIRKYVRQRRSPRIATNKKEEHDNRSDGCHTTASKPTSKDSDNSGEDPGPLYETPNIPSTLQSDASYVAVKPKFKNPPKTMVSFMLRNYIEPWANRENRLRQEMYQQTTVQPSTTMNTVDNGVPQRISQLSTLPTEQPQ